MSGLEVSNPDATTQKLIILPGMEVSKARRKQVDTLTVWLQCFGILVAVLAQKFPEVVPDMMMYIILIIQTHRDYEDPAWQRYDEAFTDKAAVTGNRKWGGLGPRSIQPICSSRARVDLEPPHQMELILLGKRPAGRLQQERLTRQY